MRLVRAIMLGVTLFALVMACAGYVLLNELRAPASVDARSIEVVIEQGASTGEIATRLSAEGLIRQPMLFTAMVRLRDLDGKLQAGRYLLTPTMTMSEIIAALQDSRVEETRLTIPEGLRLEEIATIVAATNVVSEAEFLRVARNGDAFRERYFLLSSLPSGATLEGYLFPDTYRIAATATVTDVITLFLDRFNEQYSSLEREVRVPGVTVHQVVTMASIVQREAVLAREMPAIAGVFWNRLKPEYAAEVAGRLGADPTIQYALGYSVAEQTWWRRDLTQADLLVDSAYNTRERPGLPPGPISNPGLDALRGAAQPDESTVFLYFVASCAKDGSHNFAIDFATFGQYAAEWQACQ